MNEPQSSSLTPIQLLCTSASRNPCRCTSRRIHAQTEHAHPQSIQLSDKSEYIHQLFNTATEKCEAIQMSFSVRRLCHLHIYSSLHKDAHQGPVSLAFPPSGSIQCHQKKRGGFPLMAQLQQNEIKRTTQGQGRKMSNLFYSERGLWKHERCNLKDERGVHKVREQKRQAFFRSLREQ